MKNKYDILMYVAAILGGVLGAYLCAKENILGGFIAFICAMYIIGHTVMLWDAAMAKREREKTVAKKKLEEKRKIVMNSEKISQNLQEAEGLIADNGIDSISMAIRALEKIENIDEKYEKVSANLKNIYYELQELTRDIENYNSDIYFDEEERNYIEERLDLIHSLKRKYGNTIEEILNYKQEIKEEINRIENLEDYTNKLKKSKEKSFDLSKLKILCGAADAIRTRE